MKMLKFLLPLASVVLVLWAYRLYGWAGVTAALGALLLWLLLHWTQTMRVLQRAARRPIGSVGSAVMLNAKLEVGMTLLHVTALTQSLGEHINAGADTVECYGWRDGSGAQVTCQFSQGRLKYWQLIRPTQFASNPATAGLRPAP